MDAQDENDSGGSASSASSAASGATSGVSTTAPPPGRKGGVDGSHNWRLVVAFVWVAVQVTLILTAGRRPDGAFGFRMFNESSTIKLSLYREVEGPGGGRARVHVDAGVWTARAADGTNHRLSWYDRVPTPFFPFDREFHASYGARAQLARLQAALDDLATHLPLDAETRRLVLDVTVRRNGREPFVVQLVSPERAIPSPPGGGS